MCAKYHLPGGCMHSNLLARSKCCLLKLRVKWITAYIIYKLVGCSQIVLNNGSNIQPAVLYVLTDGDRWRRVYWWNWGFSTPGCVCSPSLQKFPHSYVVFRMANRARITKHIMANLLEQEYPVHSLHRIS